MIDFKYITAEDFDRAWLNFELDLPLEPGPCGEPNPFYVDRPGNPVALLEDALLAPFLKPPKFFFSGHRGCGKSTELHRIAANQIIQQKYYPIHFTIKDVADINNLDYRDVLFAIGGQMYQQYRARGGRLPKQLLSELETFRGKVEREVTITPGRMTEAEIESKLESFFAQAGLKIKLEPHTRTIVRQIVEQSITELIELIGTIAKVVLVAEKRWPLVLIDDLDKPDLDRSRKIFHGHGETMLQPSVPIVYTVSSPLFYSPEIRALLGKPIFLPNVKLHEQGEPNALYLEGYRTLRMFVHKRMHPDLIDRAALDAAVRASGGVFREMGRIMRGAMSRVRVAQRSQIILEDIERAEAEIRGEYRRFLTKEQREILRNIRAHNRYDEPDKIAPLLQMLAALEYANGEPWCDVHPALYKLLDEPE